ncbi:Small ribosomal subunit biogenesis GTPase RsgA 1 [Cardamine amara subsp. amara]|uniref:Small ribosomal subunit biogenesis GTPase RsgA 1 n=1 Tax=Cardamine amara subsp. amara TaxID=228776 RepID=A0ABD1BCZ8_CARAN
MQIFSNSIIRHSSPVLRRTSISHRRCGFGVGIHRNFYYLSAKRENPNNVTTIPQLSKTILRSFLAPVISIDNKLPLDKITEQATGIVAAAQANFMRVIVQQVPEEADGDDGSSQNGVELLCVVRTLLKKVGRTVLVGDKVLLDRVDWVDRRGKIIDVFKRFSENLDPPVANVDHLLILFSLDEPKLEPSILTRFLVEAESTQIPITLALNKCELVSEEELESWEMRLRSWNYEPLFCSVRNKIGLDAIEFNLRNQTSVIIGPSGVGKSSLINELRSSFGGGGGAIEFQEGFKPILGNMHDCENEKKKKKWFGDQSVGEVSTGVGRGKQTTRNVTLLPIPGGGYLADTPGFNKHKLLKVTKQNLPLCFPEIRKMVEGGTCRFNNCSHIDVQGCAVVDGWERYPYYLKLLDEIRIDEESQLKKYGTKREGDVRYKMGKDGVASGEPRIQPKKCRRESRKKTKQRMISELED